MHRQRKSPPSYRLHAGSGQAIVTLNGKTVYLGKYGTKASRDEYDRIVGEWLQAGRTIVHRDTDAALTVGELLAAFIQSDAVPESKRETYKQVIKAVARLYKAKAAESFGPLALKAVRQSMVEAGLKRSTINARVHMVRRIWKWGVAHEMLPAHIAEALQSVEALKRGSVGTDGESDAVEPVAVEHVGATLAYMTPTVKAMVEIQMLTGMRSAEVCAMRTRDIDTRADVWIYRPQHHKTENHGKLRDVAIGPKARSILEPLLLHDLDAPIFSPSRAMQEHRDARAEKRKTPLSCGNKPGSNRKHKPEKSAGDMYDSCAYRKAVYYACDHAFPPPAPLARRKGENATTWRQRLGVAKWRELLAHRAKHRWHPHQLRHTFATLVREQFSLEHAQKALGHSSANVTQIYAKLAQEKSVEVAKTIG